MEIHNPIGIGVTMTDRLLTGAEVAERLNMPQATLRYWRHVGEGPSRSV